MYNMDRCRRFIRLLVEVKPGCMMQYRVSLNVEVQYGEAEWYVTPASVTDLSSQHRTPKCPISHRAYFLSAPMDRS